MKRIATVLFLLMGFSVAAWADMLTLKNGNQYKGAVLKETRDEVEMMLDVGVIRFRRTDVASIKKGSIWENNFYLKKAQELKREARPSTEKTAVEAPAAKPRAAVAPTAPSAADAQYREKEIELRKQELELKRMELELQREELKLKQATFERKETERPLVEEGAPAVKSKKGAISKEQETAIEEEALEGEVAAPAPGEELPLKKPVTEEEARQIAIEEQQKEQERKDRLESSRRLQEIRQKQEGVTIRGKINPAATEKYETY